MRRTAWTQSGTLPHALRQINSRTDQRRYAEAINARQRIRGTAEETGRARTCRAPSGSLDGGISMAKKFPLHPKHPERICWGCDRYCPTDALACGNGSDRTMHPAELLGDDWYTVGNWDLEDSEEKTVATTTAG